MISMASGRTSAYAMAPLQARGVLFIHPQVDGMFFTTRPRNLLNFLLVYPGMVIGEASKLQDIYVNPCLKKQLTNIRAAGADEKIVLSAPRVMTLEEYLAYMGDDELVEVTPGRIRLRKTILDQKKRLATLKKK